MESRDNQPIISNRPAIFLLWLLIWGSVSVRWVMEFVEEDHPGIPILLVVLGVFGLLMAYESLQRKSNPIRTQIYLAVQTVLVYIAMRMYYQLDFFALLYLPLASQAVLSLSSRSARGWLAVLVLGTVVGQIDQFGWPEALPFMMLYVTGVLFVALFSQNTVRAEKARLESEELLGELRMAHQKLREYAGQAEALAVAEERNRLARELHDSVAQTLYGLSLRSEAALRNLRSGKTERLEEYLSEFQGSALQSLRETRLLIHELRPQILAEQGLSAALQERLDNVERRSGLQVEFAADPLPDLAAEVEIALYRIVLEALNNVLKHAGASTVQVFLKRSGDGLLARVKDDGAGVDESHRGGVGLRSMRERAAGIGAEFTFHSAPGKGTAVEIFVPEVQA